MENIQHLAPDIVGRLVRRPEDLPDQIEHSIELYKNNVLVPLEVHIVINQYTYLVCVILSLQNYIVEHNRQYLIELDANLPPLDLFKVIICLLVLSYDQLHGRLY